MSKVAMRNASGAVIGMLTLNDIRADYGLAALQREIDDNMRPEIIAAVGDGGRLIVTDATAAQRAIGSASTTAVRSAPAAAAAATGGGGGRHRPSWLGGGGMHFRGPSAPIPGGGHMRLGGGAMAGSVNARSWAVQAAAF
jgi:hypothetical protein